MSRIEVERQEFPRFLELHDEICKNLQTLGLRYITLDLQGFRSGSMDEYLFR